MKASLITATLLTLGTSLLSGCFPLVVAGGAATVISAHDRRTTGAQADDEMAEWKAAKRLPEAYRSALHVNFTAFDRTLLMTGEALTTEARDAAERAAATVEGIHKLHNEVVVAPLRPLSSRSEDLLVSSRVRAQLVASQKVSANHVKLITEDGVVFLLGLVNAQEAREAVSIARTTGGVRKVVDLFKVIDASETRRLDNSVLGSPGASR